MSEEKKVNPAFTRAATSKVVVEHDLGPMNPQEDTSPPPFVRASSQSVKVEESLTDQQLERLFEQEKKMKEEIEKITAKPNVDDLIVPENSVNDDIEESEFIEEEITLVSEPDKIPSIEGTKSLKINVKKDNSVTEAIKMLKKADPIDESIFYKKDVEGEIDLSDLINDIEEEPVKKQRYTEEEKPIKKAKVVDISNLTIVNKTEIDKERDLRQALFNNKAAFQIVAAQSGYMAKVSPLVHKDIVNMLYGNLGRYEYKKAVYKTVHDKVFDTSIGRLSFDEWLKYTSVEDMETFYYGVYASTFPNEGSFRYTCPECGEEHDYKVNHNNLIKTTDREHMKKLIDEVSAHSTSIEKMKQYSLVGKGEAIQLSESGLIIELKTPSLLDSLDILRTVPEKTIDKDAVSVTNMLYINKILIPTKDNPGAFTEEINKLAILRVIDNLPIDDASELQVAVYDRVDKNRISYSIKNIKCIECSHEEKDIPISIEEILFTLIFEKTQ